MSRSYALSTWLQEFSETTGRLRGVACDDLLEDTGDIDEWAARDDRSAPWRFERNDGTEVWRILEAVSHSSAGKEGGVRWLHSFDYKDSDAWSELGPMVGITDEELMGELPRLGDVARSHGRSVEVDDYVDLCNLHARNGMRLFSVNTHGDNHLYVALTPGACAAAIERGLLQVGPVYQRTPIVGMSIGSQAQTGSKSSLTVLGIGACVIAVGAVVYTVVVLARSKSPIGALLIVIAVVVGFELAKSAAIRRLDAALGGRHPTLMRVVRFLTRT